LKILQVTERKSWC